MGQHTKISTARGRAGRARKQSNKRPGTLLRHTKSGDREKRLITFPPSLGERIQHFRRQLGYTQREFCIEAELNYATLIKIEQDAISSPSVFTVRSIANALDISLDELLEGI